MALEDCLDISVSGIEAQRFNMELISSNLANMNSTHTVTGGPYRRKIGVFSETPLSFNQILERSQAKLSLNGGGVKIKDVVEDFTPPQKVYDPGNPDADAHGYVHIPNVSLSQEMVDMIATSKLYDANITTFNTTKKMMLDTLQLP